MYHSNGGNRYDEPVFDEQAQREIISIAAQLQREEGQRLTLSELERSALEAGIEPRFLREAVARRQSNAAFSVGSRPSPADSVVTWPMLLICAGFVLAQFALIRWAFVSMDRRDSLVGAVMIAVFLGWALPQVAHVRRTAALLPIVSSVLIGEVFHFSRYGDHIFRITNWFPFLFVGVIQALIAVGIHISRTRATEATRRPVY